MTRDEFLEEQFRLSVRAGMNQRYHQARASHWECWDRWVTASVGVLATVGAILAFVPDSTIWSRIVACAAAIAAIVLNVTPLAVWSKRHSDLFRRWTDLREDVDSFALKVGERPTGAQIERLGQLIAKSNRLCGEEPAPRKSLWDRCDHEEREFRGIDQAAIPAA